MLRQAQHELKISKVFAYPFVRPEPVERWTKGFSATSYAKPHGSNVYCLRQSIFNRPQKKSRTSGAYINFS